MEQVPSVHSSGSVNKTDKSGRVLFSNILRKKAGSQKRNTACRRNRKVLWRNLTKT